MKVRGISTRSAQEGFTLIELVLVISLLGILATVALPKFFIASESNAKKAAKESAVAAVNTGLAAFAAQQISQGNSETYPSFLDGQADNTIGSISSPLFTNVLKTGVTSREWEKMDPDCYQYDNADFFQYDDVTGEFSYTAVACN